MGGGAWKAAVRGVVKSRTWLSDFTFTFHFHAMEKEMATHSSVLAWRIPGMGEPGRLPSLGSQSRTRLEWLSSSSSLPSAMAHTLFLSVECVSLWINPLLTSHFVSHQVLNKVCNLSLKDHRFKSQYELHGFMKILEAGCRDIFDLCSHTAEVWFWRTQAFL